MKRRLTPQQKMTLSDAKDRRELDQITDRDRDRALQARRVAQTLFDTDKDQDMRRFFMMALTMLPLPAFAQDGPTIQPEVVEACFVAAVDNGTNDPSCIGNASNACQELPGGATTPGIAGCISDEAAAWDVILNREYTRTKDAYGHIEGASDKLLQAQRAWITMRDADCDVAYDKAEGGSIRSVLGASCRMAHTAQRALQLRLMREW